MYRHCPSAKTGSKEREDFPEPETPVMTVTRSWGMARETFFRLFCLAPSIRSQRGCAIRSVLLRWKVYLSMHRPGNRTGLTGRGRALCRVERITDDARVQDELDVYNAL